MRIEVIAIGNEILSGDILDTNFSALATRLKEIGAEVARHVTAPDVRDVIADEVRDALTRAELLVVTGGLGPTSDDLTRFGVADGLGLELEIDAETLEGIRERFSRYGVSAMPEANNVQAMFPRGARILDNDQGTAPGFHCRVSSGGHERSVMVLPGPPREFRPMIDLFVVPFLEEHAELPVIRVLRLRTLGVGESMLAEKIADWPFGVDGVEIGYYPQNPGVDLKVTARADTTEAAESALWESVGHLRRILGHNIYGRERVALAEIVGGMLRERGRTLALAESCTGGLLGAMITAIPGSSDYFDAGVISYSYAAKEDLLGVPHDLLEKHGAVSEEVVCEMADQVRRRRRTDYSIAITGIAGPGGEVPGKPVGLVWAAVSGEDGTVARRMQHAGDRSTIQLRSAVTALDMLRRRMLDEQTEAGSQ